MIAYKLFRKSKKDTLHSLFINKTIPIEYNIWLHAENHPTKGFAVRAGWHCTLLPVAPHLKINPKNGMRRVWCEVEIKDYIRYARPESQGGTWLLAQHMKVIREL